MASAPKTAPTASMTRKRAGPSCVNRKTQESGKTVTMWNMAKLASGAKAPMTTWRPSARSVSAILVGWSSRVSNRF